MKVIEILKQEQGTQHKIAHTNMNHNQSQAHKFIAYAFALCMEIQPFRMQPILEFLRHPQKISGDHQNIYKNIELLSFSIIIQLHLRERRAA